ncbi:MAG: hypothetical protein ACRDSH_09470, partial [Pseudonocardiaceae bacterium]
GGVLWGLLPGEMGISWEGHLFGALGGLIAASIVARTTRAVRPEISRAGPPRSNQPWSNRP